MLGFLKEVKWQTLLALAVFLASIASEVWVVYLLKEPVNVVQRMSGRQTATRAGTPFAEPAPPAAADWRWLLAAEGSGAALRHALLLLAAAQLLRSVLLWARSVALSWQNMTTVGHMRAAVYDRLQRVGFAFYDRYTSGQLINRAISDLNAVRQFLVIGLRSAIDVGCTFIGYLGVLWLSSPLLAGAALLPVPLWLWVLRSYARRARPMYERQKTASDDVVHVLTENIAGAHVVRAFTAEDLERQKFERVQEKLFTRLLESIRLQQIMLPLLRGVFVLSNIALFTWGAVWVQGGMLQLGDLVVFGVAVNAILGKLQQLNEITESYQKAIVSGERLLEILDSPDTTPQQPGATRLRQGPGAIRLSGVTFGYSAGDAVLVDVDLEIPAGTFVALVGPTGAGKSTLAALIGRCYDPWEGSVEIDGQDLRTATVRSIREAVGYVFQESYLFNDTVARNIAYGDLSAPMADVRRAAQVAHAEAFIEQLPEKYDTLLGEYGVGLSGGQRQRLALARAVLHDPRVLVLDDALSAVDAATDAEILENLEEIRAGRTLIMVTQRLATARRAEMIVVLAQGRVAQIGTHDELVEQPGFYRYMALTQFGVTGVDPHQAASHVARELRLSRAWTEEA
jgi:ATP-binding cassette subfamily B protein